VRSPSVSFNIHELPQTIETFALYTPSDVTHILLDRPTHALQLPSPASYVDIDYLVRLARDNRIDSIHPGYGFLSESAVFAQRMQEVGVMMLGPGADVLRRTGDKLSAKRLAEEAGVPVLTAMAEPTGNVQEVWKIVERVGLPVMIKAVDGGGGRGIRLVAPIERTWMARWRGV
jgi:acetyl/propionyl-CoA carboxylase alpha subunit